MSELRRKGKKIIAWVLTFVLLLTNVDLETLAGDMIPYASYLDGWKVDVAWSTMTQNYEWNATADEVRQPKIVVTYRMENAEKAYPAGSLSFTIPGIGGVKRSGTVKADKLAADQGDSEWDYTWDPMTDTYQFTNKFAVSAGQSVSGGFELLWTLEARDCENGFTMEAAPVFSVSDAGSILTEPLRFSFTSVRDRYRIRMERQNIDGATYEKKDKNYTWYNYRMYFDYDWLARGLYKSTMNMTVSGDDGLSDGDIIAEVGGDYKKVPVKANGDSQCFDLFTEKYGNLQTHYVQFRIGFKTDILEDKDVTVHGHLSRLYNDEEDWTDTAGENECVDAEETFTLHGYSFNHTGYIYNHWSFNYNHEIYNWTNRHDAPLKESDRLNATGLYNGKIVPFQMNAIANRNYTSRQSARSSRIRRRAVVADVATDSNASESASNHNEELKTDEKTSGTDYDRYWKTKYRSILSGKQEKENDINDLPEDWNDLEWAEHGLAGEAEGLSDGTTFEDLHPQEIDPPLATGSDADEDEDYLPDITLGAAAPSITDRFRDLFSIKSFAAEVEDVDQEDADSGTEKASPSNAAKKIATRAAGDITEGTVGGSGIGENDTYSLAMGDDKLAVYLKNGSMRALEDEEYDIAYVQFNANSSYDTYDYEVYGAATQDAAPGAYTLLATGKTNVDSVHQLPDGVKAVYILVKDVVGSYTFSAQSGVRFHVSWQSEQEKDESERIDHTARLVNFTYLRSLYYDANGVLKNDCALTTDNYGGTYGQTLAERDYDVYGEGNLRDYSNVWLRDPVTNLEASVNADKFSGGGKNGFTSTVHASGTIQADTAGTLKKFSLYASVPEGLSVDPDEDEIIVSGSGTSVDGASVNDFMSHASIHETEWNGKTVVAADFDFSDDPLSAESLTRMSMKFPVSLAYADFLSLGNAYQIESCVMAHDTGLAKITGSTLRTDEFDLDEDGDTGKKHAYSYNRIVIYEDVTEWREYASKYIKSNYSTGFTTDTVTRLYNNTESDGQKAKSDYQYRLDFGLGSSNAKNIVFYDRIEQGAKIAVAGESKDHYQTINSAWQGSFVSVDTSQVEKLGMVPTIYYSADAGQEFDLSDSGWTTTEPADLSAVRSIAVALDTSAMEDGLMKTKQMAYVIINMRAPSDRNLVEKKAVNQYTVTYDAYGLTGQYETAYTLDSSETYVKLLDNIGKLVLQKVDADNITKTDEDGTNHYASLTGAKFQIYGPDGNALFPDGPKELNSLGRIVMNNVRAGKYSWEEVEAPAGYQKSTGRHTFTVTNIPQTIQVENSRIPGSVTLTKHDADDETHAPLANAKYRLYQADGTQMFLTGGNGTYAYSTSGTLSECATGADGTLTITGLPWGGYYLQESEAPIGYDRNDARIPFEVGRAQYHADTDMVSTTVEAKDPEKTASIRLTKYDAVSGKTLKDAYYDVAVRKADGTYQNIYEYRKTNAAGELTIEGLKFGHYRFTEVIPPAGYKLAADTVEADLDETTADTVVKISQTDERKTGSVKLMKLSSDGMPLADAEFSLYRKTNTTEGANASTDTLIRENLITSADGTTDTVADLEWGEYYFNETRAPQGYQKSDTPFTFTVDASNADSVQTVQVSDDRILGSVVLTKMDEATKSKKLADAQFSLRKNDGTLIKEGLKTDADGVIKVTDLNWGSYYFEETKAPAGYGLNSAKIRFSINETNCTATQQLTCYDPTEQVRITIKKNVNAQCEPFGNATFLFEVKGTDINGTSHTWQESVTLSDGALTGETVLSGIPAGTYTITERGVERYKLESVTAGKNVTVAGTVATADLSSKKEAEVTFTNAMTQYEKFSHAGAATNVVDSRVKLTGIRVTYKGPATIESETESSYAFTADDLEAVVFYDDGSSRTVVFADLMLDPATVTGNNNSSGAGYTVHVSYMESGITVTDGFSVEVNLQIPPKPFTVTYDANGGYFGDDTSKTLNQVTYERKSNVPVTKIAKTDNVSDDGGTYSGGYGNNQAKNTVITIPGAETLKVTITYQTESTSYDWACLYQGTDITPSTSNYNQSVSGKLGGKTKTTKEFEIQSDTVQIFFRSDSSADSYYGFYAVVEDAGERLEVTSGEESQPDHATRNFAGWYTDPACTDGSEFSRKDCTEDVTVYAKWKSVTSTLVDSGYNKGLTKKIANIAVTPSKITSFKQSNVKPAAEYMNSGNIISTNESETPVYLWKEGTSLLWWSKAETVYANSSLYSIFNGFSELTDISGLEDWNAENTKEISYMFLRCTKLADLSPIANWNMEKVTNMDAMFYSCNSLTDLTPLSGWNTGSVTNMRSMFSGCDSLTDLTPLSGWDTGSVTSMSEMFYGCDSLTDLTPLSGLDTGSVKDMNKMFYRCDSLTDLTPLSGWDTRSVTNMSYMFASCSKIANMSGISGWDTGSVKDMRFMFNSCNSLTDLTPLSDWDTGSVKDMCEMFYYCNSLTDLTPLSGWNTGSVTDMSYMFASCSKITNMSGISGWDTGSVKNMSSMFSGCNSLTDLTPLSGWDIGSVTSMSEMFYGCDSLTDLTPLSSWNTGSVTSMNFMFAHCRNLINASAINDWDIAKVTNFANMFFSCPSHPTFTKRAGTWDNGTFTPTS